MQAQVFPDGTCHGGVYNDKRLEMEIIRPSDFTTTPWKNGGGVTHEIMRCQGTARFVWRLSIAEVARSGSFSLFPGHRRCLTVIEGEGMELVSPTRTLVADLLSPVWFSGDEVIDGRLRGGACRDFNVIFDPLAVTADVAVVNGSAAIAASGDWRGAYVLNGSVTQDAQTARAEEFAVLSGESVAVSGLALFITLTSVP